MPIRESARIIDGLLQTSYFKLLNGAGTDKYLKSDASGNAVWADLMPHDTGGVITKCVFYQATAPLGWTKQVADHDYFMRIVTDGSGGSGGGSWAAMGGTTSSNGSHSHTVNSHGHGIFSSGGWSYTGPVYTADGAWVNTAMLYGDGSGGLRGGNFQTDSGGWKSNHTHRMAESAPGTNSMGSHTHSLSSSHTASQHKYMNVILCAKD